MKFIKDIIGEKREHGFVAQTAQGGQPAAIAGANRDLLTAILAENSAAHHTSDPSEGAAAAPLRLDPQTRVGAPTAEGRDGLAVLEPDTSQSEPQPEQDVLAAFFAAQGSQTSEPTPAPQVAPEQAAVAGDTAGLATTETGDAASEEARTYRIFTRRHKPADAAGGERLAGQAAGLDDLRDDQATAASIFDNEEDQWALEEPAVSAGEPEATPVHVSPAASAAAAPEPRETVVGSPQMGAAFPAPSYGEGAGIPTDVGGHIDLSCDQITPPAGRAGRVKTRLLGFDTDAEEENPFAQSGGKSDAAVTQFPVGWLAIVDGPGRGAAFTLFSGVSVIGRGQDQTVRLDFGDSSISRDNHAAIAFDPEQQEFFIGHGGKANLVRRNGRPVLATETLAAGDVIRIGETTLRFVPLCGADFSWLAADGVHRG